MADKSSLREVDALRRLAFLGVAVSTIATLTAIIAVPMLYNYIQVLSCPSFPIHPSHSFSIFNRIYKMKSTSANIVLLVYGMNIIE